MKDELISIIVPVYNGGKTIKRAIKSIFTQDYPAIEIVIINDGSTDNSESVINSLVCEEPSNVTIHLFYEENSGICKARNLGIDKANGKYIVFMDQDDEYEPHGISELAAAISKGADFVIGGFRLIDSTSGKTMEKWVLKKEDEYSPFRITAPWSRIFRKEIIDRNHIRFFDTKISEDFYFNFVYLSYCNKVDFIEKTLYKWYFYKKSESHKNMSVFSKNRNPFIMLNRLFLDINPNSNMDKNCFAFAITKEVIWYLYYINNSVSSSQMKKLVRKSFTFLDSHLQNNYSVIMKFGHPNGERFRIRLIVKSSYLLYKLHLLNALLSIMRKK